MMNTTLEGVRKWSEKEGDDPAPAAVTVLEGRRFI